MSNQLEEVKCPFYITTRRSGAAYSFIDCEGLYDGSVSVVRFNNLTDYLRHKITFCESIDNCPKCPYFQVASFKYT